MNQFFYATIYLAYLLIPGGLILSIFKIKNNRFLLAYGISYSTLILTQLPFRYFEGRVDHWLYFLHLLYILVIAIAAFYWLKHKHSYNTLFRLYKRSGIFFIGFVILITIFLLYHWNVLPYTEIPSDYWEHLARVVSSYYSISNNQFNHINPSISVLLSQSNLTHFLHALVAYALDSRPVDVTSSATFSLGIIFLGSIYWFTIKLFSGSALTKLAIAVAGLIAVVFTVLTFGTATFSFVRYYSYFPTIFCFPIVYLCVVLIMDYLEQSKVSHVYLLSLPVFIFVVFVSHAQEALFVFVLVGGIIVWRNLRLWFQRNSEIPHNLGVRHRVLLIGTVLTILALLCICLFGRNITVSLNSPHIMIIGENLLPWGQVVIADPTFRFWDTLGYFGVIVYCMYFFKWSLYKQIDYINVGMAIPLITFFNPIYSYVFLTFEDPSVLWRTAYLIPISIVAAYLIVYESVVYLNKNNVMSIVVVVVFLSLSSISMFPMSNGKLVNRTTKLPSLSSTSDTAGSELWGDMISAVSTINDNKLVRDVLTDHVTNFVLDSAVFGNIPSRDKKHYFPSHNQNYKTDIYHSDFSHHLLVINKRNGAQTYSSLFAGHWDPTILQVSSLYPPDLEDFIENNRNNFELVWQRDNISIYQIISFVQ